MLAVVVVAVGDDGVQAVVAAVELDHDQDAALGRARTTGGQRGRGAGQEDRHACCRRPGAS